MQYRSPISLLAYAGEPIEGFSAINLTRARKRLLAEISLQGDAMELDGISYTRNDIISLFETITEQTWPHHCKVYCSETLYTFLQKGIFDSETFQYEPLNKELLQDADFVAFISPCVVTPFQQVSGNLVKQADWYSAEVLIEYSGLMETQHRHEAFSKIRNYAENHVAFIRNLEWWQFEREESTLYFLFNDQWIDFVNSLPDAFDEWREELVMSLLSLIGNFQFKATWGYLHEACTQLEKIKCDEDTQEEVARFKGIMKDNMRIVGKNSNAREGKSTGTWGGSYW